MNNKTFQWSDEDKARIQLASNCKDSAHLPKVEGAGELVGENYEFQRMHNGILIKTGSYHGEWMTEIIKNLQGHHEPQEEKVFSEVLSKLGPNAVMLELGSFWAYYSLWFQQAVKNATSIMVEPNPKKLEAGKQHFALNNFKGSFIQGFVGEKSIPKAVFTDWDGTKSEIPQVSVDSLMKQYNIDFVDIVHADIQGAESDMLKGAEESLSRNAIKYIFISTHGNQHRKCLRMLSKYKYQIICEHSILESFSGDGLIVAHTSKITSPLNVSISKRRVGKYEWLHSELAGIKKDFLSIFSRANNTR